MQTEKKNKKRSNRKKKLSTKVFHLLKYVIDCTNVCFFCYLNSRHCFMWLLLHYLLHLFNSDRFAVLISLPPYKFLFEYLNFFKNHLWGRMFHIVKKVIWKMHLQRNLRTDRAKDCIFRASMVVTLWVQCAHNLWKPVSYIAHCPLGPSTQTHW